MRSTNTQSPFRARRIARLAAIAAAGAIGIGAVAGAGTAFAATSDNPSGTYSGTIIVNSVLSIQPSSGTFGTVNVTPGTPFSPAGFTVTIASTDEAGYSLTEAVQNSFGSLSNGDLSSDVWTLAGHAVNGSENFTLTDPAFGATGVPITLFSSATVAGQTADSASAGGAPYSPDSSHDIYTTQLHILVPSGTPGSAVAGLSGSFLYTLIGN
jgi:hypothetical protein